MVTLLSIVLILLTSLTTPQPACTPPGGDLTRAVDEQVTIVAYSSCYLTVRRSDGTTRTVFVGFAEKDWTPSIGTVVQLRYDPVSLQGFYLISQTYPWKEGVVVPTPTPTPTPVATPTPTPTPTPIATPTPLPPATCSITVPASLSMGQWSYAVATVGLTGLTGPVSVSAYSNTGQVGVYPSSQSVTGTSASLQFQVSSKKKSGTVTFNSPCGSRTLQVIVK